MGQRVKKGLGGWVKTPHVTFNDYFVDCVPTCFTRIAVII